MSLAGATALLLLSVATSSGGQPPPEVPSWSHQQVDPRPVDQIAQDGPGRPKKIDPNLIYFGNPRRYRRPAVLTLSLVFAQLPSYLELKGKGYGPADAEYWILLNKANARFNAALARVLEVEFHDLVVELGAMKFPPSVAPVDITDLVIAELKKG